MPEKIAKVFKFRWGSKDMAEQSTSALVNTINSLRRTYNNLIGDGLAGFEKGEQCVAHANARYKINLSGKTKAEPESIADVFYIYDRELSASEADIAEPDLKLELRVKVEYKFDKGEDDEVIKEMYDGLEKSIAERKNKAEATHEIFSSPSISKLSNGFRIGS